ncbi:E3 ubiquitin-protein ligase BRE1-like 1 [Iris pallida]|uniref:E3 ubiquitin protein ligase n=1 Tax=Iris pallida TaxID=29817 RepID=A0AAX6H3B2_IRIPA|nr:E3 ubiquitin-protein ligase BRE1-like 1 [Iris pallida]
MGSTGEPDRKRRHFSSISPAAAAKKQPAFACSEDKKLDFNVLKFQNQKLVQQVEAQKVEYSALESRYHQVVERERNYDKTLVVSKNSWERLVGDLESRSVCTSGYADDGINDTSSHMLEDGACCPMEDEFLSRLLEPGATESCSDVLCPSQMKAEPWTSQASTKNILRNTISSVSYMWRVHDEAISALLGTLSGDECHKQLQKTCNDWQIEVRNFQVAIRDLHLKHKVLTDKVRKHRDIDAKYKTTRKRLSVDLSETIAELEESKCKLATLKAQKDTAQGTPFLFPTLGDKQAGADKVRDRQKELQDLESTLEEMKDLVASRAVEISSLHEGRIEILKKLASLQNALTDAKAISSSQPFLSLNDQLDKSKTEMDQCRTSLEKLQVEKDNFICHEKEVNAKVDLADVSRRVAAFSESQIAELEQYLQKLVEERIMLETKLEDASRESGRKEIIAEFKALLSTLPKEMGAMQTELSKYKEEASEIHSLRAEVQSLSSVVDRKVNELESLSGRWANQLSEIKRLHAVVQDLKVCDQELKLILEMYQRESTDSREVMESRDMEYKVWAHVQSLKSSLDEHKLELRVKEAIEAEAISQQRLATAEAEIADLRRNLEFNGRDICKSSEILKSKHEEGESYLSEIESIGQAYEDMQTQNQHLLQQVTERDDYNIKLVMEGLKARQSYDALCSEICYMGKKIQHTNSFLDLLHQKVARFDDQLKNWSDQVRRLAEDGWQNSNSIEDAQRRLTDIQSAYLHRRQLLDEKQSKVEESRLGVAELLVELEKERFSKKRTEESLEVAYRKATYLRGHSKGSTVLEKLKQEIREYKGILKCNICRDRQKEVVIAKCFHLFCGQCVKRTPESRHRKCPTCGAGFGVNDVKPIYI